MHSMVFPACKGVTIFCLLLASLATSVFCHSTHAMSWDEFKKIEFKVGALRNPFLYKGKILGREIDPFERFQKAGKSDFFWAEGDLLYAKKGKLPSDIGTGIYVISQRYTQPLEIFGILGQVSSLLDKKGVTQKSITKENRIQIHKASGDSEVNSYSIDGIGKDLIKGVNKAYRIQTILLQRVSNLYIISLIAPKENSRQWKQFDGFLSRLGFDVGRIDDPNVIQRHRKVRESNDGYHTPGVPYLIRDLRRDLR